MDGAGMDSGGGFDHLSPDPDLRSLATLSVRVSPSADDNADGIFQRPPSCAFLAQRGLVAHDFVQFWPVESTSQPNCLYYRVLYSANGAMVRWAYGASMSTPGAQ